MRVGYHQFYYYLRWSLCWPSLRFCFFDCLRNSGFVVAMVVALPSVDDSHGDVTVAIHSVRVCVEYWILRSLLTMIVVSWSSKTMKYSHQPRMLCWLEFVVRISLYWVPIRFAYCYSRTYAIWALLNSRWFGLNSGVKKLSIFEKWQNNFYCVQRTALIFMVGTNYLFQ